MEEDEYEEDGVDDVEVGSVAAALRSRHGHSTQPESKQVLLVIDVVLDAINSQGLSPSPAAIFAAAVASLNSADVKSSPEMAAAFCTVLEAALERVSPAVVAASFEPAMTAVSIVMSTGSDNCVRVGASCLGHILAAAAVDGSLWPSGAKAFGALLRLCTDKRPKVRRAAAAATAVAMGALREHTAGSHAADATAAWLGHCTAALSQAAQAVSAAKTAEATAAAEEGANRAVTDALHTCGALKTLLPALSTRAAAAAAAELVTLLTFNEPMLSQHASDALYALFRAPEPALPASAVLPLLRVMDELPLEELDSGAAGSMSRLLRAAYARLYQADQPQGRAALPRAFQTLARLLSSGGEGAAMDVSEALKALIRDCIDREMVADAVRAAAAAAGVAAASGQTPGSAKKRQQQQQSQAPLAACAAALEALLGYRYRSSWPAMLPVLAVMFERLGPAGAVVLPGAVQALGEMATAESLSCRPALLATLGAAIRHLGPERVVAVLPLDCAAALGALAKSRETQRRRAGRKHGGKGGGGGGDDDEMEEAADEEEEEEGEEDDEELTGNTWLLPLLSKHVKGSRLAFWVQVLLPQAKAMEGAASVAKAKARGREAALATGLETSIWDALPAFATDAEDIPTAFPAIARELGVTLSTRSELRAPIIAALHRLLGTPVEGDDAPPRRGSDPRLAAARAAVVAYARNFLPILFNIFVAAPPEARSSVAGAISAFSAATDAASLGTFFRTVMKKYIKVTSDAEGAPDALLEGGSTRSARRATFMELMLAMLPGLDEAGAAVVVEKVAVPAILEAEAAVQKKGYKILAWLEERKAEAQEERGGEAAPGEEGEAEEEATAALLEAVNLALPVCAPASRHHRHKLLAAVLPRLGADALPAMKPLLGELILGTKEPNSKTRAGAYDLIVGLARRLEAASEAQGRPGEGARVLFGQVLAGLVGTSPTMVAAAVMAAARLLYEFSAALLSAAPKLLPAALALLRGKNREVIKAVLGLVKVMAVRLPPEQMLPLLPQVSEGLLVWSSDSKNRFKSKVRTVMERLVRRCGYDAVAAAVPPAHVALLEHIRRQQGREERKKRGGSVASGATGKTAGRAGKALREWNHSEVFSEGATTRAGGGRKGRGGDDARTEASGRTARSAQRAAARERLPLQLKGGRHGAEVDLMDDSAMRRMLKHERAERRGGGGGGDDDDMPDFGRSSDGRIMVEKEGKRKRGEELEEEGGGDDGASQGGRSRRSAGGQSQGGKSSKWGGTARSGGGRGAGGSGKEHSADRFRSKKARGDVSKGAAGVQPYAYWPLDTKLLNRREAKRRQGRKGLDSVVNAVRDAAAKGARKGAKQRRDGA